jgi:hypothetical protein
MKRPKFVGKRRGCSWMKRRKLKSIIKNRGVGLRTAMYCFSCNVQVDRLVPERTMRYPHARQWRYPWRVWKWHPPQATLGKVTMVWSEKFKHQVYRTKV